MTLRARFHRWAPAVMMAALTGAAPAQGPMLTGRVAADSAGRDPLPFVHVVVAQADDSTRWSGGTTDIDGRFRIGPIAPGDHLLKASAVGHAPVERTVRMGPRDQDLGTIVMPHTALELREVTVEAVRTRVEQLGDTTQYHAGAFTTAPDASAEDLIRKLPGVVQDAEGLKVQGEKVNKVLVDGREFFGDDPNMALKNLPAEVVDKIQVFEKQSDQAQFSGFEDGAGGMTINIVTKEDMRQGVFGRLYAGHDGDDRYTAGGSVNIMNDARRISIIGMSTNINQQNFSDQDLLGVSGGGGGRGGGRGGRGGGGGRAGNFLVGPQGGVAVTHSIGLNYSDEWGRRTEVTGSYFLNVSEREQVTGLVRQLVLPGDSGLHYTEDRHNDTRNLNHRLNLRIEHKLDSVNSFVLTPRLNLQHHTGLSGTFGTNAFASGVLDSRTENVNTSERTGHTFNTGLLWRRKLGKRHNFSLQADIETSDRSGEQVLRSLNLFELLSDTTLLDRRTDELTDGHRLGLRANYTVPVGEHGRVQVNYAPSYRAGLTRRMAYEWAPDFGTFAVLDTSLSNRFASTYMVHRGGATYRMGGEKWSWSAGVDGQHATLSGDREFPIAFAVDRTFTNLLPNAMVGHKAGKGRNIRLFYRTSTREPSIDQLQDVVDISNPLFLRTGNPRLAQSYTHNLSFRLNRTQAEKGTSLFAMASAGLTQGHIATGTIVATHAPVEVDGITVPTGGQLSRPVNMDGAWNARAFITYGMPVKPLRSNLNINGGYNFSRLPALVNGATNLAAHHTVSQGLVLSSNISERIDFAAGYDLGRSFVRNSLQAGADNDYFSTSGTLRLQWTAPKLLVVRSQMAYTRYDGLAAGINDQYLLWNAAVGAKLLKDRSLELALNLFDILNENNSIARNVTETWIEDSRTNVLGRYFMVVATWNLRHFPKAKG
ncbi:MAG: outer membrane beta-barrel protein [Flavobacteriales bacterium]|jgi:hypothetical protein|nr:outer membrane beta-barrel protein [Flavobacteriales bacterium]